MLITGGRWRPTLYSKRGKESYLKKERNNEKRDVQ